MGHTPITDGGGWMGWRRAPGAVYFSGRLARGCRAVSGWCVDRGGGERRSQGRSGSGRSRPAPNGILTWDGAAPQALVCSDRVPRAAGFLVSFCRGFDGSALAGKQGDVSRVTVSRIADAERHSFRHASGNSLRRCPLRYHFAWRSCKPVKLDIRNVCSLRCDPTYQHY